MRAGFGRPLCIVECNGHVINASLHWLSKTNTTVATTNGLSSCGCLLCVCVCVCVFISNPLDTFLIRTSNDKSKQEFHTIINYVTKLNVKIPTTMFPDEVGDVSWMHAVFLLYALMASLMDAIVAASSMKTIMLLVVLALPLSLSPSLSVCVFLFFLFLSWGTLCYDRWYQWSFQFFPSWYEWFSSFNSVPPGWEMTHMSWRFLIRDLHLLYSHAVITVIMVVITTGLWLISDWLVYNVLDVETRCATQAEHVIRLLFR